MLPKDIGSGTMGKFKCQDRAVNKLTIFVEEVWVYFIITGNHGHGWLQVEMVKVEPPMGVIYLWA